MDIVIIGAGGGVGRQLAQAIVAERLLERNQRLVLVGNKDGSSARALPGFAVDLMDAYAEISPKIEVIFEPDEIRGDLIVMAGGKSSLAGEKSSRIDRGRLAEVNLPVFEEYASAIARNGHGHEIMICVSNPNELAVASFARRLERQRVIGMGAFLDSWRFRKEIARELNIRRQRVHGFMVGEHGSGMVPLWSSVHIYGLSEEEHKDVITRMRRGYTTASFINDTAAVGEELTHLIREGKILTAYDFIDHYPPDIRAALRPLVTHFSGAKTVMGTAQTTLSMLKMILLGNDALVAGQVAVEGEFYDIHSTIGVPFVIGNRGVDRIIRMAMDEEEIELLIESAKNIQQKLDTLLVPSLP